MIPARDIFHRSRLRGKLPWLATLDSSVQGYGRRTLSPVWKTLPINYVCTRVETGTSSYTHVDFTLAHIATVTRNTRGLGETSEGAVVGTSRRWLANVFNKSRTRGIKTVSDCPGTEIGLRVVKASMLLANIVTIPRDLLPLILRAGAIETERNRI